MADTNALGMNGTNLANCGTYFINGMMVRFLHSLNLLNSVFV